MENTTLNPIEVLQIDIFDKVEATLKKTTSGQISFFLSSQTALDDLGRILRLFHEEVYITSKTKEA